MLRYTKNLQPNVVLHSLDLQGRKCLPNRGWVWDWGWDWDGKKHAREDIRIFGPDLKVSVGSAAMANMANKRALGLEDTLFRTALQRLSQQYIYIIFLYMYINIHQSI